MLLRAKPFPVLFLILVHSTDIYLPMKMEQTECSETSAYKLQTPGNYPKESIQHTEHGESLKSKTLIALLNFRYTDFYTQTKCKVLRLVRLFKLKLVVASSSFMSVLRRFSENLCSHLQNINAAK